MQGRAYDQHARMQSLFYVLSCCVHVVVSLCDSILAKSLSVIYFLPHNFLSTFHVLSCYWGHGCGYCWGFCGIISVYSGSIGWQTSINIKIVVTGHIFSSSTTWLPFSLTFKILKKNSHWYFDVEHIHLYNICLKHYPLMLLWIIIRACRSINWL